MFANSFYVSVQQSSTSRSTGAAATQKTRSSSSSSHPSAAEMSQNAKYWTYKATEISIESGEPDSNSSTISTHSGSSLSSDCSLSSPTASAEETSEGSRSEVKLPKNAMELIAWAITQCNTTTPTLSQIAGYIQTHVSTYRDEELSILIKMVLHHLNKNNPAIFLPVMSPAGHMYHNPSLARWAINRQVVTVADDGSIVRRRHRSHAYGSKRPALSSSSSSSSSSSCVTPLGPPSLPTPLVMSSPDGVSSGSGHNAQFGSFPGMPESYYNPAASLYSPQRPPLGQAGPALTTGSSLTVLGGGTPGTMPTVHSPPMGTGLFSVPFSSPGAMSSIHSAPPQAGVAYQLY